MDFAPTLEQREITELARRLLGDRLAPERTRAAEGWDRATWEVIAGSGLLGITVPAAHGGLGLGALEACSLLVECGRVAAPLPAPWSPTVAHILAGHAPTDERERWLPSILAGTSTGTIAGLGATYDPPCLAVEQEQGWHLRGSCTSVPFGAEADLLLVAARTADGPGLFAVTLDEKVTRRSEPVTPAEPRAWIDLGDEDPTPAVRLGGRSAVEATWAHIRVGLCALQVGLMEGALSLTTSHVGSREQFGRPIGAFQGVALQVADAHLDLESATWTMWRAASCLPDMTTSAVPVATFWACHAGHRVLSTSQHLHGGIGVDVDYPLHRYFLRAKQIEFLLGGSERALASLGASLAGQPHTPEACDGHL